MNKVNIKLYDTKSGKKLDFVPLKENEVTIYYCGPTVYDYPHIGNFRPPVFFDLVHRFFLALGYNVKMVSNYTDIDDKIINKAIKENKTEKEISSFYIKNNEEMLDKLNVLPLYNRPKVSETMDEIISFVQLALDKGVAYKAKDDIYFSTSSVKDYGSLSKMNLEELNAGSRIEVSDLKHSPFDFALWKKTDDAGIKFNAPFGVGRPGWHTECLVMINKVFNKPLVDIHGGGFDLKFPHHENERAQSMAVYSSPLANYWMHVGFLTMGNSEKMSKSLGNVIYMKDFLNNNDPDIFRLLILKGYYRSPLVYSEEAIETCKREVEKYRNIKKMSNLFLALNKSDKQGQLLEEYYEPFINSLADDFNVPNALLHFDLLVKNLNQAIRSKNYESALNLKFTFDKINDILGLKLATVDIDDEILNIYHQYEKARLEKNYALSDELRLELVKKGVM